MTQENNAPSPETANGNPSAESAIVDPVQALEASLKEKEAKYLYLYAEFETFKKRMVREKDDLRKFGWEPVARDLLGILDNFGRAVQHAPASTDKNLLDGLKMIMKQFEGTLEKSGVTPIQAAGNPFDPNLHEAVGQEHSSSVAQGNVTQEHERGYTFHGRLLRPAKVLVSMGAANSPTDIPS